MAGEKKTVVKPFRMTEKEVEYELNEYQEEMLQRYQKVLDYTFN